MEINKIQHLPLRRFYNLLVEVQTEKNGKQQQQKLTNQNDGDYGFAQQGRRGGSGGSGPLYYVSWCVWGLERLSWQETTCTQGHREGRGLAAHSEQCGKFSASGLACCGVKRRGRSQSRLLVNVLLKKSFLLL